LISKLKSLKDHQGFVKYAKNTSWIFAEKILRMIVGLFVGIWVARYLGPEQYGLLSYAQSFVGLFTLFAVLGLDRIVIRELVKDEKRRDELLGTAFWLKLVGACLVLMFLAVAVNFTSNDTYTNILVFIIASATIFQSFNVIDMYFQSRVLSKYIVYANIIALFVTSVIKVLLILNEAPLIAFVWVVLFNSFILALGYLYFYFYNKMSLKQWKFEKETAKKLLNDSWPLILSEIVISIYMKIDQVMIKEMLDSEAVGQYAAAVNLSQAWYFIPTVIASSLFPAIINAKKQSEELYYNRLQRLYDLLIWMAIVIALPMTFLSDWFVNFLYGKQYDQAGSVLMIHIWIGVFSGFAIARSKWVVIENLQKYTIYMHLAGALSNIVLNYYLIELYKINGAAYASFLSFFVAIIVVASLIPAMRVSVSMYFKSLLLPLRVIRVAK